MQTCIIPENKPNKNCIYRFVPCIVVSDFRTPTKMFLLTQKSLCMRSYCPLSRLNLDCGSKQSKMNRSALTLHWNLTPDDNHKDGVGVCA